MKIGVLLKQVPDTETRIKLKADASGVEEGEIKWVINPYDEYALEEALRLKEAVGVGEVVVVTAGPKRSVDAMRQAMAMGADRGIFINAEGKVLDNYTTAVILFKSVQSEKFDILFAGKQAVDDDSVQVAHGVASFLGWPCVWPVEHVELSADKKKVTLQRPVGGGVKEIIEMDLPGVVCSDKGEHEPRYASLPGIMKAKTKPLAELSSEALLTGESPKIRFANYGVPSEKRAGKILKGDDPEKMCAELVRLLHEEAKVI